MPDELKTIDLTPFCEPDYEKLAKPWCENGKTFATDSIIGIRLYHETQCEPKHEKAPDIQSVMIAKGLDEVEEWFPFPEFPMCIDCKNLYQYKEGCEECNGTKTVTCNYDHEHDCDYCDENGMVNMTCDCEMNIGTRIVAKAVASKAASLPNAVWGVASDNRTEPIFFRFDGGDGVFMPLNKSKTEY